MVHIAVDEGIADDDGAVLLVTEPVGSIDSEHVVEVRQDGCRRIRRCVDLVALHPAPHGVLGGHVALVELLHLALIVEAPRVVAEAQERDVVVGQLIPELDVAGRYRIRPVARRILGARCIGDDQVRVGIDNPLGDELAPLGTVVRHREIVAQLNRAPLSQHGHDLESLVTAERVDDGDVLLRVGAADHVDLEIGVGIAEDARIAVLVLVEKLIWVDRIGDEAMLLRGNRVHAPHQNGIGIDLLALRRFRPVQRHGAWVIVRVEELPVRAGDRAPPHRVDCQKSQDRNGGNHAADRAQGAGARTDLLHRAVNRHVILGRPFAVLP